MGRTTRHSLRTPDSPNIQVRALAGSYVAALVAPALTLFAVEYFNLRSGIFALAALGAVGITLGSVVVLLVTDTGRISKRLNAGWSPWVLALVGFVPMVGYYPSVVETLAYLFTDLKAETTASLVGTAGFILGIAACWFGEMLVRTIRNQVASFAVANEDVTIEWTAAWPRADKMKVQVGVILVGFVFVGLLAFWYSPLTIVYTLPSVLTVGLVTNSALADRVYRLTPSGLVQRRKSGIFTARQFLPWSQIDAFTVTDGSIILHRRSLRPAIRFARQDIRLKEDEITDALDEHLDRRIS